MRARLGRRLPWVLGALGAAILAVAAGFAFSSGSGGAHSGPSDVTDPARFDLPSLDALAERLLGFGEHYRQIARPFEWTFTRQDLAALLHRIDPTRTSTRARRVGIRTCGHVY